MINGVFKAFTCSLLLSVSLVHAQHPKKQVNHTTSFELGGGASERDRVTTAPDYKKGTIRHIVLFKFKPTVDESLKQSVAERFLALQTDAMRDGSNYIVSIEYGNQMSLEASGQGFEQGYIVTFQSEGDRNFYVGDPIVTNPAYYDPIHHAFKAFVGPLLDEQQGSLVFDFRPAQP